MKESGQRREAADRGTEVGFWRDGVGGGEKEKEREWEVREGEGGIR